MKDLRINLYIKKYIFLLLILSNIIISLSKKIESFSFKKNKVTSKFLRTRRNHSKNSYQIEKTLKKFKKNKGEKGEKGENLFLKFIIGLGVGFGLSVDASEELKKCFLSDKKKNSHFIKNFIQLSNNSDNQKILEKNKDEQKESAKSFTKSVLELFSKFKECNAFKETFLDFVKIKIFNVGIKGLVYVLAGPLGIILKGTYDIYKLISEINNFYIVKKRIPLDHYNLGSSVGKIIYYTQNILLGRKRRF